MDDLRHDVSLQDELCNVITTMDHEVLIPMVEQHHTNDNAIARIKYRTGHLQVMFPSCNGSSDSTQIVHQCHQNFNDSQMYISAGIFPLVFMFSVRRQMSPVSARRVAFVFRDFPIGFI